MRAPNHLTFIRTLPCLITGVQQNIHAAHIRYGSLAHGKRQTGAGEKPSDIWTVPLHADTHLHDQHARGERVWWSEQDIDPLTIAALLWACTGDYDRGYAIIANARVFTWR